MQRSECIIDNGLLQFHVPHRSSFMDDETQTNVYVEQIKYLSQHEITTVYIDFGHLAGFNEILAQIVATQYYR